MTSGSWNALSEGTARVMVRYNGLADTAVIVVDHDVDVQDGLAYLSYWNDGLVILDVAPEISTLTGSSVPWPLERLR